MPRLTGVDVAVFNVGGLSLLADLREAEVQARTRTEDVTPLVVAGESRQAIKQSVAIQGALTSSKTGGAKVTHLDVQLLELAGLEYRSVTERIVFEGRIVHEDGSGIGDEWEFPIAVRKDYRAQIELSVDSGGSPLLVSKAFGELAGKGIGYTVAINGVSIALPMVIARFQHQIKPGSRQKWLLDLVGSAPTGAAYPTAPTGSDTLLEHAFTSPGVSLPVAVDAGPGQPVLTGQFLVSKFGFQVSREGIVESAYDWVSQGAVALS